MNFIKNMKPEHKGILVMIIGLVLLANVFGLLGKGVDIFIVIIALCMILYGFFKSHLDVVIYDLFKKMKHK